MGKWGFDGELWWKFILKPRKNYVAIFMDNNIICFEFWHKKKWKKVFSYNIKEIWFFLNLSNFLLKYIDHLTWNFVAIWYERKFENL